MAFSITEYEGGENENELKASVNVPYSHLRHSYELRVTTGLWWWA